MILHKSENLLNLAAIKELPEAIIKGLFIRFNGVAAAGVTVTVAQLGQVRVNYRGADIINVPFSFIQNFDNLHFGTVEFASAVGAAFTASGYVPFHAYWDNQNGLANRLEDKGFIELRFPALTAAVIASGTVEIYYVPATGIAGYIPMLMQQNIQAGGAGQVVDRLQQFNISEVYFDFNAAITNILIYKDGKSMVSATQAVLQAKSNMDNQVETAITLIEVDLNPNKILTNALGNLLELNLTATGATTYNTYYMAVVFSESQRGFANVSFTPAPTSSNLVRTAVVTPAQA